MMEVGGGLDAVGPAALLPCSFDDEDDDLVAPVELPPGFRFHPTDEEIIMHYLIKKVMDRNFSARAIGEADLNKSEPWDLPKMAKMGEKEWFFFSHRDRKYPTGVRTNRATESGYWKATGKDKEIYYHGKTKLIGMKKTLVFYKGRAPKGAKTKWVMHEFRLEGYFSRAAKEEWVVCRVFCKNMPGVRRNPSVELARIDSLVEHLLDTNYTLLPPLADYTNNDLPKGDADNKIIPIASSSTLRNNFLMLPYQHHQASPSSSSLGYQCKTGFVGPMGSGFVVNTVYRSFKGIDPANLRLLSPKMENNSTISQSQETGLSIEYMANNNEITSMHGDVESEKPFDQELDGLNFSLDMSDLDSIWNY